MKPGIVYVALRKTSPGGFWRGVFATLTKWRLVTRYPHAGIVVDGRVYHTTLSGGLHAEDFDRTGWDLFATSGDKSQVLEQFSRLEGTPYDWFSLLAFVFPWRISDSSRLYCYEWVYLARMGFVPPDRITAEDLIFLSASDNYEQN
jgi:hypothetical protein